MNHLIIPAALIVTALLRIYAGAYPLDSNDITAEWFAAIIAAIPFGIALFYGVDALLRRQKEKRILASLAIINALFFLVVLHQTRYQIHDGLPAATMAFGYLGAYIFSLKSNARLKR